MVTVRELIEQFKDEDLNKVVCIAFNDEDGETVESIERSELSIFLITQSKYY